MFSLKVAAPHSVVAKVGTTFLLVIAAVLTLGLGARAEASTVGNCTVDGVQPLAVQLNAAGKKTSGGKAALNCGTRRYMQVEIRLRGDDAVNDDLLVSQYWSGYVTPQTGVDMYVWNGRVPCNEDNPGGDELYSETRARIYSGGIWSAWSAYDRSATYAYTC